MASLFIDSTYDITLGILDNNLGWMKFDKFIGQKASAIIQTETHNMLKPLGLKLSDLESIITIAGPGFYTGLRLSEGFADVLIFSGLKHYSFLSSNIPLLAGIDSGTWMTKAYRGEYFFHSWKGKDARNELVPSKDLEKFLATVDMSSFYIHSDSAIDDFSRNMLGDFSATCDLIKKNPQPIFSQVLLANMKIDSFYFRAPEDEFKVSI